MSTDLHRRAFLTHFEIACEFGILICLTDMFWLIHDIVYNGFEVWYMLVGMGLTIGLLGTVWVCWKHHKQYTHRLIHKKINKRVQRKLKDIQRIGKTK